jgi:hypothetical protein
MTDDDQVDMNGKKGDGNCVDTHSHQSERSVDSPEPEVNYVQYSICTIQ